MDKHLVPLLVFQERDVRVLEIEDQLRRIPLEIAAAEQAITTENERCEAKRKALQALEVRRKEVDGELGGVEEQIVRYKNQQLAVKKQEELEALNHEIDQAKARAGELEEAELELLLEIDEATTAFQNAEADSRRLIELQQREIEQLKAKQAELESQHDAAQADREAAAPAVEPRYLAAYQRVRQRRPKGPIVVPIESQQCGGCHLRVAGETDAAARLPQGPVHCESCGRMLYVS